MNIYIYMMVSPLTIINTQKPFEVKWKQNKRPSGVCYVREWSNWPNLTIRNNIPEDWPTIIIGFMYLSFFIHLNCIQTNFTPLANSIQETMTNEDYNERLVMLCLFGDSSIFGSYLKLFFEYLTRNMRSLGTNQSLVI
jgi:hypothetical protein